MNPFSEEDTNTITAWLRSVNSEATQPANTTAIYRACASESEWLDTRSEGIGASEIGVVMGASKWTSPYALWWRKKLDWRIPRTAEMMWGHLVEDPIATLFADEMSGYLYVAKPLGHPYSLWCHPTYRWVMCTPDRLAVTSEGRIVPVEIKSDEGGTGWGSPGTDIVPLAHRYQALWQACIFDADGTYIVRKTSSGKRRMTWYWIPRDHHVEKRLILRGALFRISIQNDRPPDPDGSAATTETLQTLNAVEEGTSADIGADLYARWSEGRAAKRDAIERDRLLSNQIRAAMGSAQWGTTRTSDGYDVIRVKRSVGKRAGYTVEPTTTDELREVKSDGHSPPNPGVPGTDNGSDHPTTAATSSEEGPRDGGPSGTEGAGNPPPGTDPGSSALTGDPDFEDLVARLPIELSRLVHKTTTDDET